MRKLLMIPGIVLLLHSCYSDSEEALFPTIPVCDTTLVSFTVDIVPILNDNCMLCHSTLAAPSLGSNIKLESYSDVAAFAERMLGAVKHEDGYIPMPQEGEKLDSCQIMKLEAWISQGKNDN
jgi:hypothetical protein